MGTMPFDESLDILRRTVNDYFNILIARQPGIFQELPSLFSSGWQTGHQKVVRPATTLRRSDSRHLGQRPSGVRCGMSQDLGTAS